MITDPTPTSFATLSNIYIYIFFLYDSWHASCDMWHLTCDTWHVTCDTWNVTSGGRWTFSQNDSSLALTVYLRVKVFWRNVHKGSPTDLISEWRRCNSIPKQLKIVYGFLILSSTHPTHTDKLSWKKLSSLQNCNLTAC